MRITPSEPLAAARRSTSAQNGSNSSWPNEREPRKPGTGAGNHEQIGRLLAQQMVASCACEDFEEDELYGLITSAGARWASTSA